MSYSSMLCFSYRNLLSLQLYLGGNTFKIVLGGGIHIFFPAGEYAGFLLQTGRPHIDCLGWSKLQLLPTNMRTRVLKPQLPPQFDPSNSARINTAYGMSGSC